jgi:hypothetical protein
VLGAGGTSTVEGSPRGRGGALLPAALRINDEPDFTRVKPGMNTTRRR